MPRLLALLSIAFAVLITGEPQAEACGHIGCHAMVVLTAQAGSPAKDAKPTRRVVQRVAPAADEAEVRAIDDAKGQPPTPAIWMQFKSYAYKQLPTHEEKRFTAVWIGMTVETPDETIPAVGLEGIWW